MGRPSIESISASSRTMSTRRVLNWEPPAFNRASERLANVFRPFIRSSFRNLAVVAAAAMLLTAGCSRLSGDHQAEAEAEETAKMERLLDDAPESLTAKQAKPASKQSQRRSSQVVADDAGTAATQHNSDSFAMPPVTPTTTPTTKPKSKASPLSRPAGRSRPKNKKPAASNPDEIPDAADIGL